MTTLFLLSLVSLVLSVVGAPVLQSLSSPARNDVIIQLFQWNWDSIASECTYIGKAGYGAVQVSPPQEHVEGGQWWTDYQPVSYTLTSKRGNRMQFKAMVDTCNKAGVKIIVDTIWNHMTGRDSGTGVAGHSFTHYGYPGTYENQDFHHCGAPDDDIANYNNRTEVQTCELVNLADLATETEHVRRQLAAYGNDLLDLGAQGFRLDAAKHIAKEDIQNILSRLRSRPYVTQEVVWGSGEPITPNEYVQNGDVQEFRYTTAIQNAFSSSGIASLSDIANRGWVDSNSANVFVANHDTERNGASLNYNSPNNIYTLAHVYMLAWPFGTPTVTSGYRFSSVDDGAPNGGTGACTENGGLNGWLCEHRWPAIAGLVGFRSEVSQGLVVNYVTGNSQQIAFGRGSLGYVVINNDSSAWSKIFTTSLPDNNYCDVYAGQPNGKICPGNVYTISGGTLNVSVPPRTAIALHTGALSA